VRLLPGQRCHEASGARRGGDSGRRSGGGGGRGRRRRLDDEAGRLLTTKGITETVDLVLERHKDGDDVGQRLVVLRDHQQDMSYVLTQLSTTHLSTAIIFHYTGSVTADTVNIYVYYYVFRSIGIVWHSGLMVTSSDSQSNRLTDSSQAGSGDTVTILGKWFTLYTQKCLCHHVVQFGSGQRVCSWKGIAGLVERTAAY